MLLRNFIEPSCARRVTLSLMCGLEKRRTSTRWYSHRSTPATGGTCKKEKGAVTPLRGWVILKTRFRWAHHTYDATPWGAHAGVERNIELPTINPFVERPPFTYGTDELAHVARDEGGDVAILHGLVHETVPQQVAHVPMHRRKQGWGARVSSRTYA